MKSFDAFRNYISENDFKINVFRDKINIVNYDSIGQFNSKFVEVIKDNEMIIVKGEELVVSKLMNDEVLIRGIIKSVELG